MKAVPLATTLDSKSFLLFIIHFAGECFLCSEHLNYFSHAHPCLVVITEKHLDATEVWLDCAPLHRVSYVNVAAADIFRHVLRTNDWK